jgi:hypothetical protein
MPPLGQKQSVVNFPLVRRAAIILLRRVRMRVDSGTLISTCQGQDENRSVYPCPDLFMILPVWLGGLPCGCAPIGLSMIDGLTQA